MNSTKNILDTVVEIQSQVVENLMDTTKKVQETFSKGISLEKSTELFKDWFEKQQALVEKVTSSAKDQLNFDFAPTFLKDMMDTQSKFNQGLLNSLKEVTKNYTTEKALDTYQEQTGKLYDTWKDAHEKLMTRLGKPFSDLQYNPADYAKELNAKFVDSTRKYIQMIAPKTTAEEVKEEAPKAKTTTAKKTTTK